MLSFQRLRAVFLAVVLAAPICAALDGTALPIRRCRRAWLSVPAPDLRTPQSVANALRRKANFRLVWWHRKVSSYYSTPVKKLGVFGWTDYCTETCAEGAVVHADASRHGFYTVDLLLSDLVVAGARPEWQGPRFIRVEIYGEARKKAEHLPQKSEMVRVCGKLMWDGDGFLEIHPRSTADLQPPDLRASTEKAETAPAPQP